MSVTENNVLIRSKDSSGNSNLYYPVTKAENVDGLDEALATKVDKVMGKGLSTNDYTTAEKNKLAGIAEGANKTTVDSALSSTSTNPVQNKVVNSAIGSLQTALDGKAASSHGTHVTYSTTAPSAPGTASAGSSATVARSDHVHPVQTSVSGNAGTATKLATARTVSLSGDVTGSVSFDGSKDVSITATVVDDSHNHVISNVDGLQTALDGCVKTSGGTMSNLNSLVASTSNTSNIVPSDSAVAASPFARDTWHDHFAFLAGGHTLTDNQISIDGTTWTDDDTDLSGLFSHKEKSRIMILTPSNISRRFVISGVAYSVIKWFEIGVAWSSTFSNFEVIIESSNDGTTWTVVHTSTITNDSKSYFLYGHRFSAISHSRVRFTFTKTTNLDTGTVYLTCLKAYTSRKGDQGLGIENEYPYDWNSSRDIYPHSDGYRNLGLSTKKWANVYATTFTGNLSGNAGTATKLATARTFRTNLGSTSTASFNGTADVTPGVTGTLGLANGGTGATTAAAGRANLGAAKVYWSAAEPSDWTANDMWLQIID